MLYSPISERKKKEKVVSVYENYIPLERISNKGKLNNIENLYTSAFIGVFRECSPFQQLGSSENKVSLVRSSLFREKFTDVTRPFLLEGRINSIMSH